LTSKEYFPALTGFRAIAAWMVFIHHYNPFTQGFLSGLAHESYIGVSLFFVLSGFLITIRYDTVPLDFGRYMQNRFARVYPLWFLLTTLTFFLAGEWGWTYVANITLIKGFVDELKFTGISQGWSLSVEETFYLLAPLVFIAIRRTKLALFIPLFLVLISWNNFVLIYTFIGRSFDFFAGIMLAKLAKDQRSGQLLTWTGVSGLLLCLYSLSLCLPVAAGSGGAYGFEVPAGLFVHHALVPVFTAVLLYGLIAESTWIRRLLSTKPMQLAGKASYAFYLVHLGVIAAWISERISSNILVLFILLNGVAIALYYTVERPLRRYFLPENEKNLR
jgi:peptidoglycan/LPS O-acetylase OafA/YrhL